VTATAATVANQSMAHTVPVYTVTLRPKPERPSKYLSITTQVEQELKDFKKSISDAGFNEGITKGSLLRFALKYGKGEFNKVIWQYQYSVILKKGEIYNTFLAMVKHAVSKGTASDSDFSGTLPDSDVSWVQSASHGNYSFFLQVPARHCGRGCGETPAKTEVCFQNGSELGIVFDPIRARETGDFEISAGIVDIPDICRTIINPQKK